MQGQILLQQGLQVWRGMSESSEDISATRGVSHCQFNILLKPRASAGNPIMGWMRLVQIQTTFWSTEHLDWRCLGMSDAKLAKLVITEFSASVGPASVLTQFCVTRPASVLTQVRGFPSFICLYLCGGPTHVLLFTACNHTCPKWEKMTAADL